MHRHERFTLEYLNKIENLLQVLTPYILNKYKEIPLETKELNKSLAHFLKVINIFVIADIANYELFSTFFRNVCH